MEKRSGKNTGTEGSRYKAVIELPEWVSNLYKSTRPTKSELAAEGWVSAPDLAAAMKVSRTQIGRQFGKLVKDGKYEARQFITAESRGNAVFYRPVPTP